MFTSHGTHSGKLVFTLVLLLGCTGVEAPVPESLSRPVVAEHAIEAHVDPVDKLELLPNGRMPLSGVVTGGQPSSDHLQALAQSGFKAVINLRQPNEMDFSEEIALAGALGLAYTQIPVGGAEDLTLENAQALADALNHAEGPVAIHCASGNRVGALLAIKAAWVDHTPPPDALELGLEAGLTRLEPTVRELLRTEPRP